MRILLLNHGRPDYDFTPHAAGAEIDLCHGPADPADMPSPERQAAADALINCNAQDDVGPVSAYPNVRIAVRLGVGFDNLDIAAWAARGVPVCNVPDYGTSEVADHAIALMLALTRGTATYGPALAKDVVGNWNFFQAPLVRRLRGATFGVIGLGRIGLAAALRARGFGMNIAFYDPYQPNGFELAVGAHRVHSVAELLAISDVVSLHAPSNEETNALINRESLKAAKPGLVIVNTARGPLIDLDALHDAIMEGRVGGAGLDVLPTEPPKPLPRLLAAMQAGEPWIQGRLIVTPHAAFYSPDAFEDLRRKAVEVVLHYLRDGRLTNCVNAHLIKKA